MKEIEKIISELVNNEASIPAVSFDAELPKTLIRNDKFLWWWYDLGVNGTYTKSLYGSPEVVYHITKYCIDGERGKYDVFEAWCDADEKFGGVYNTFKKANNACEKHLRDKLTKEQK